MNARNSVFLLFFSLSSLGAGLFLASAHPVAPLFATLVFLGVFSLFLWQPRLGLMSVPVFLPVLNFSPWTGWLIVDEFDLLVLAVAAAGYFRMRRDGLELRSASGFFLVLALVVLLVARGANDLGAPDLSWFAGYLTPLNSLRVGKSLFWIALLFPLLERAGRDRSTGEAAWFVGACLLGSCWVVLAVFWERTFYPGLLDISTPYRTVGPFWEMHQGGAALDAYLVLIAPLLVWAWRTTTSLPGRMAIGAYILAFAYVCLTTFSRGVFGAIAGSVFLLGALLLWRRIIGGRTDRYVSPAGIAVVLLLALEVALVLGADSFLSRRLAAAERDFGGRLQHWGQGIGLLKTPGEWLFGIGIGQLPARFVQGEGGLSLPGSLRWDEGAGRPFMAVSGPGGAAGDQDLGGLYALSQRVDLIAGQPYRFAMDVRSEQDAELLIQVCELHLLYPANCQGLQTGLNRGAGQRREFVLSGDPFESRSWSGAGHGVFLLSVLTPQAKVELADLHLSAGGGNLLRNARFLDAGAGWFPAVRFYFLPWHIDNLYLEILIETGLVGLFLFLAVVLLTVRRLVRACARGCVLAPYYLSCIAGLMALGLVVSVLDMPRVATLFGLFLVIARQCPACGGSGHPRLSVPLTITPCRCMLS